MSFKLRLPEVIKKTSEKLKLTLADQSFSKVLNFLEEWQPCKATRAFLVRKGFVGRSATNALRAGFLSPSERVLLVPQGSVGRSATNTPRAGFSSPTERGPRRRTDREAVLLGSERRLTQCRQGPCGHLLQGCSVQ